MKKICLIVLSAYLSAACSEKPAIEEKPPIQTGCAAASTGFVPINDLGVGTFTNAWGEKWKGGLYTDGSNYPPAFYKATGIQLANMVQGLDPNGYSDEVNGKIVWISIGMSNTTQETQQFIQLAKTYPNINPKLTFVDGAVGGMTASIISSPGSSGYTTYWTTVATRLANSGVSANQVQVIWLKEANVAGSTPVRQYYDSLKVQINRIVNELKTRFPNVKLCYISSRISGRYATTTLNPEPYAYYSGWAVKSVIEDKIDLDSKIATAAPMVKAPWLGWGVYLWSDGSTPQYTNPNVFWNCPGDFNPTDGTHPSVTGAQKVGELLLTFFSSDSTAKIWFLKK
ncbi:MAG: hypothetical protein Q8R90_02605 [Bacteroidales bacterium]|nr:hypothetical protein [Bacteroidales bacterium]